LCCPARGGFSPKSTATVATGRRGRGLTRHFSFARAAHPLRPSGSGLWRTARKRQWALGYRDAQKVCRSRQGRCFRADASPGIALTGIPGTGGARNPQPSSPGLRRLPHAGTGRARFSPGKGTMAGASAHPHKPLPQPAPWFGRLAEPIRIALRAPHRCISMLFCTLPAGFAWRNPVPT